MSEEYIPPHKENILAVADVLFTAQGYNATGIKQIVYEAEVARQTFYNHFASKEALGLEWLAIRQESWMSEIRTTMDAKRKPLERVLAAFSFLDDYMRTSNYRGCPFLNISAELSESDHSLRIAALEYKTELRTLIHEEVKAIVSGKKGEGVADTIFLLFEGAMAESQLQVSVWPIEAAKKAAKRLLK